MALLKDKYGEFAIEFGDEQIDEQLGDQLKVSKKELSNAVNAENLAGQIFKRVLTQRAEAHRLLIDKLPDVQ